MTVWLQKLGMKNLGIYRCLEHAFFLFFSPPREAAASACLLKESASGLGTTAPLEKCAKGDSAAKCVIL